jgi:hypothetical protein
VAPAASCGYAGLGLGLGLAGAGVDRCELTEAELTAGTAVTPGVPAVVVFEPPPHAASPTVARTAQASALLRATSAPSGN